MRHCILIWLFIVVIPIAAYSQNCGLSDTISIEANSSSTIDFTLSDYFNDDLSDPMQGLCGVELHFLHQLSENLEISLTSPAGQTVNLIGPNTNDPNPTTFFAKWKITFVQCGATAEPDLGYLAQWDNDQPNDFVWGGQYSGSYYPYSGCLEDFNTGPVNGQWTFNITNDPSEYIGALVFMRLIFCDARGVDCCFAVPGEIEDPDILICEGDSSLIFDPDLTFVTGAADTSEYGYQFAIFEDSLLVAYDTTINLLNYPSGNYEVCGLSYRLTEQDSIPAADGTLMLNVFRDSLYSLEPWFCGLLTDSCMSIQIVATPDPVNFEQTICAGDSLMVGDTSLIFEGLHSITLQNYAGCDSIVNVNLYLEQAPVVQLDSTICLGDSAMIGNSTYTNSGTYSDTLQTFELGCDSIINLNLTVLQPIVIDTSVTICNGDNYAVGDSLFTDAGVYSVLMTSSEGCDSIVNLTLSILEIEAIVTDTDTINCNNVDTGIFLNGSASTPAGILSYDWYTVEETFLGSGLLLTVLQADTIFLEVSATQQMTTCFHRDSVIVVESLQAPIADAGEQDTITCINETIILGGPNTSTGGQIDYQWTTTTGNFVSSSEILMPEINGQGVYSIVVTDLGNGCMDTSEVLINIDTLPPVAEAGGGATINCLTFDGMLSSTGSSTGINFEYNWGGPCIETLPSSEPDILVSCAGIYYLEILNLENGCISIDSAIVVGNQVAPLAVIAMPDTLNCFQNQVMLDASASTPPDSLLFEWTGPGIISPNDVPNPLVNLEGLYTLVVSNIYNNCTDTTSVLVINDTAHPVADAGQNGILTCNTPELPLGGPNTSIGAEFIYIWITSEGHFTGPTDLPLTTADSSGVYQLQVLNQINGCRDTSTVIFGADQQIPYVDAGNDQEFTCGAEVLYLDGADSDTTQNITVLWTGPCIETSADSLVIEISCPGTYYLELTDIDSGCQNQDTVVVSTDFAALFAELPDTAFISCETGSVILDGSASSFGIYQWLLEGEPVALNGNSPTVLEPGFYQLIVSNISESCIDTAGINVVLDCGFELTLENDPPLITCTESTSQIEVAVSPPFLGYEYDWSGPAPDCIVEELNEPIIEVRCAGFYTLIVTNPNVGISDTIIVEVLANEDVPVADAGPSGTLTCFQNSVFLDGSGSTTGISIAYIWTNFNDDTLGVEPIIPMNVPGVFLLEVVDTLNDCKAFDVVEIFQNNTIPNIVFGSSVFQCESDTFALESFVNPLSDFYEYTWAGDGIVSTDSSTALINTTGEFILEVIDTLSGCSAIDTVTVIEQICVPCIEILPPDTLSCNIATITLQGAFCEPCIDCEVEWTTAGGLILSDSTSLNTVVGMPGTYFLTATDTLGFTTTLSVVVPGQIEPPFVFAGLDNIITCDSTEITIGSLVTPSNPDFSYTWSSINGATITPNNEPTAIVSQPDTFILEVQNLETGCIGLDTVVISIDTIPPFADAGATQFLTCDTLLVVLDGSGSLGNNFNYEWQPPGADCIEGENMLGPIVSCPGNYLLTVTNSLNGCTDTSSVNIGLSADIPSIAPISDGVLDCQITSLILVGNTPSPASDYAVSWCPLDDTGNPVPEDCVDTLQIEVTTSGEYQFEIINNASGCSNAVVVTVSEDAIAPVADAGEDDALLCTLDSLELQGTAGPDNVLLEYLWTAGNGQPINNEQTLQAVIFEAGTYFLEVTNLENQCSVMDSVEISQDDNIPVLDAGPDTLLTCLNNVIQLNGQAVTSSGIETFFWNTDNGNILSGDSTSAPVINQPGFYYLSVLDVQNGCIALDSVFVDELIAPPTAIIDAPGALEINCIIDTILVNGFASFSSTGAGVSFQWGIVSDGHLIGDLTAGSVWMDEAGVYRLIVMDEYNGCLDSLEFTVAENIVVPELNYIPPVSLTCDIEEVIIDASATDSVGMSIFWSTEDDGVIAENVLILPVTNSGVYMLTVVNETNGCDSTEDIFVDIDTIPPTVIIESGIDMLDCEISEVEIDARNSSTGSQYEYQWTANPGMVVTGFDSLVTIAGASGFYTLQITNLENGCSAEETVEVLESAAPLIGVNYTISNPNCLDSSGGSVRIDSVLGGTPQFLYSFNGSSFNSSGYYSGLAAGIYELIIKDDNGCDWEETITLLDDEELIVSLGVDIELTLGDSIELEALVNRTSYDTLYWMPAEAFEDPSNPVQVLTPSVTTAYSVFVVDENGCTDSDVIIINLIKPRQFFIPNVFSPANADGQNDVFMIFGGPEIKEIITFQVYDRWGNQVYENSNFQPNNPAFGWDGKLNGRLMNSSVFAYYVKIEFVDGWIEDIKGDVILMR
jgi:gliding motility-associated-like protein